MDDLGFDNINFDNPVKKQKYIPDWTKVKCTVHLLLMYVGEMTEKNPDFTFTTETISQIFGISRNAAWNLIHRVEEFRNFERIVESRHVLKEHNETGRKIPSKTLGVYKITYIGMRYAKKLAQDVNKELLPESWFY
jgi:hypothetical protein